MISAYSGSGVLIVTDPSGSTCTFDFEGDTEAPKAGVYKVVAATQGVGAKAGEVVVSASHAGSGGTGYMSTNENTKSATVSVNGGKITVSVQDVILKNMSGGMDELRFSANEITQTN